LPWPISQPVVLVRFLTGGNIMGLNLSNEQIAHELAVNSSDVQQMTAQLREGIVKKSLR
jgi:uncharacterized protein YpbB